MRSTIFLAIVVQVATTTINAQSIRDSLLVEGMIIDAETAEPLHGAFVGVHGIGARLGASADKDGRFRWKMLRVDTLRVIAGYLGYSSTRVSVFLQSKQANVFLYLSLRGLDLGMSNLTQVVPKHWNAVDANRRFSFYLSSEMRKRDNYHGIDTYVESYESKNMLVSFDYGAHTTLAPDLADIKEVVTIIGCKRAKLYSFTNPIRYTGYTNVVAVDFDFPFTFWVEYNAANYRDTAMTIVYSLKFPTTE